MAPGGQAFIEFADQMQVGVVTGFVLLLLGGIVQVSKRNIAVAEYYFCSI